MKGGVYRMLTNERKAVVAGEVKEQSVHRHNGARFGCKSAESAGIFV